MVDEINYVLSVERQVSAADTFSVRISPDMGAVLREEYANLQGWVELDTVAPNLKLLLRRVLTPPFPGSYSEE